MPVDARLRAWIALTLVDGLGSRRLHALLTALGTPEAILAASSGTLSGLVPAPVAAAIRRGPEAARQEAAERWLEEPSHRAIAWDDPDYPPRLLSIPDPPPVVFFLGRRGLLDRPALAIVGSRNATPQGVENAEAFARALGESGLTIVSGLALGIDAAAHRGGLATSASSLAVIGTGPDRVYPARNRALAHELASRGGVLSEFPPGTPALAANFPRRNRIISGLACGVLVVEATLDSGSLITARLALEQGREVFAIPGSIHSPFSKGCHRLIKDGAKLVETADDVLSELGGWGSDPAAAASTTATAPPAGPDAALLAAMGFDPVSLDALCARTGNAPGELRARLTALELAGRIGVLAGNRFQRLS